MIFRAVNWGMAGLFGLAAVLQYNDPDPARWIAIYAAAMLVAAHVGYRGAVPVIGPLLLAAVAVSWGLALSMDVREFGTYGRMLDEWRMSDPVVEEARETGGLLIVAGWMAVLVLHGWRRRRALL